MRSFLEDEKSLLENAVAPAMEALTVTDGRDPLLSDRVLYVSRLDPRTTWLDLLPIFEPFDAQVMIRTLDDIETHRSRGFGYINFSEASGCAAAVAALRGEPGPFGRPLEFVYAEAAKCGAVERSNKLFIRNVPPGCSDDELADVFSPHGDVTSVRIMHDRSKAGQAERSGNRMAYVTMATDDEACVAMKRVHTQVTLPGTTRALDVRLAESEDTRHARRSHPITSTAPSAAAQRSAPANADPPRRAAPQEGKLSPAAPAVAVRYWGLRVSPSPAAAAVASVPQQQVQSPVITKASEPAGTAKAAEGTAAATAAGAAGC